MWSQRARVTCPQCQNENLCELCDAEHHKSKNFKEHKRHMHGYSEIPFGNCLVELHGQYRLCLYCEACRNSICSTCAVTVHKDHKKTALQQAAETLKIELQNQLNPIQDNIEEIKQDIKNKEAQLKIQQEVLTQITKLYNHATILTGDKFEPFVFVKLANEVGDKIGEVIRSHGDSKKAQVAADEELARLLQAKNIKSPSSSKTESSLRPNASSFQPQSANKKRKKQNNLS